MGSSLHRVRLYSRLAALMLAAAAALAALALRVPRTEQHFASLTIISYIASEPASRRETPPPQTPAHPQTVTAAFVDRPDGEAPARLWSYNALGQIVFDRPEHYRRCLAARDAHHNEADCPEPHDPHQLVLRPGAPAF